MRDKGREVRDGVGVRRGHSHLMYSLLFSSVTAISAPPGFSSSSNTCEKGHRSQVTRVIKV